MENTTGKLVSWRRVKVTLERSSLRGHPSVRRGTDIVRAFLEEVGFDPREVMVAFYLDARHVPIGFHIVSIGTASATTCDPTTIFGPALSLSASAVILAHNHPSGDPSPSAEDQRLTTRMKEVGELVGIEVLDHVVIGATRHYSFASEGTYGNE